MKNYLLAFLVSASVYAIPPCEVSICSHWPSNTSACSSCRECKDSGGFISISETESGTSTIECRKKSTFDLGGEQMTKEAQPEQLDLPLKQNAETKKSR